MEENNANNDFEQENQHQENFIPLTVNSHNETGRKEIGEAR